MTKVTASKPARWASKTEPQPTTPASEQLYEIAATVYEYYQASASPADLLEYDNFLRGVARLGSGVYSNADLINYYRGDNAVLACMALEALARRADRSGTREGLLDGSTIVVHGVVQNAEDRAAVAETGCTLSFSIESELRLQEDGDFRSQMLKMLEAGVNLSCSVDSSALTSVSMFDAMLTTWAYGIPWADTDTADSEAMLASTPARCQCSPIASTVTQFMRLYLSV